jgi:hypothetical protein
MSKRGLSRWGNSYEQDLKAVGFTEIQSVYLTKGDNTGTLLVDGGQAREIWVHRKTNTQVRDVFAVYDPAEKLIVPLRNGDTTIEKIGVRIGKPPLSEEFIVMDTLNGKRGIGQVSPFEAEVYNAKWVPLDRIIPLRGRPTDPASTNVEVDGPIWYVKPSTNRRKYITLLSCALASTIAALSSGQHQLGMLYLDKEAGTLNITTLPAVTAMAGLPSRAEFASANVEDFDVIEDAVESSIIYLYYGQTSVVEVDFYRAWDQRPLFGGRTRMSGDDAVLRIPSTRKGYPIVTRKGRLVITR